MTPHIEAKKEDIASIVLMPGDPKRAEFIANTYLKDSKLINKVRGMLGYTGFYKGKRITVMASGMGCPSIGIYSYELFKFYDVESIIRIGSCGAFTENLNLYDVILVKNSYSKSSYIEVFDGKKMDQIESSDILNEKIKKAAEQEKIVLHEGNIYTTDVFYASGDIDDLYNNKNCLGTEMETFALFYNAKKCGKKAAAILTVSDNLITKEKTTSEERQNAFNTMMELALDATLLIN